MRLRVAAPLLLLNSVPALHFVFWYVTKYCSGSNSSGWHLVIVPFLKLKRAGVLQGKKTPTNLWLQLGSQKYNYMNHFLFNICPQKLRETNSNYLLFLHSWNLFFKLFIFLVKDSLLSSEEYSVAPCKTPLPGPCQNKQRWSLREQPFKQQDLVFRSYFPCIYVCWSHPFSLWWD